MKHDLLTYANTLTEKIELHFINCHHGIKGIFFHFWNVLDEFGWQIIFLEEIFLYAFGWE